MGLTDHYPMYVWVLSAALGLLTFPLGLLIPGWFYYKTTTGDTNQTTLEIWTVLLLGIFGIGAVELGGRTGAKVLWGFFAVAIVFFILLPLLLVM